MRLAFLALVLLGCAYTPPAGTTLIVAPDAAEVTLAAVDMWTRATGGEYAPEVVISETCPERIPEGATVWCVSLVERITAKNCNDASPDPWGCTMGIGRGRIQLSTSATPDGYRVSTVAHELGHTFGLTHDASADDLMDPARDTAARANPCVSADDVMAAGFAGLGACL